MSPPLIIRRAALNMTDLSPLSARRQASRELRELLGRHEQRRGLLVAFEGPDGSGKSTQRRLFRAWLRSEGYKVVTTKWSSSPLVKPLIKARKRVHALSAEEYAVLHAADFRHRVESEILPALWSGRVVVADRYLFTALARDAARGLDLHWLLTLYTPLLWPDVVFYFSVSPATSGKRVAATGAPKYYEAGQDVTNLDDPLESYQHFIGRVIREYEALALIFNFITIDAEQSIVEQHRRIRHLFHERDERPWSEWNLEAISEWVSHEPLALEIDRDDR